MNAPRILSLAAAAALALAAAVRAETLATWPLNNTLAGTTTLTDALTVGDVTAGSSVGSLSLSKNGYVGNGWAGTSLNDNAYYQFAVTASEDYSLKLADLTVTFGGSKTGPAQCEIRYSLNGTSWTKVANPVLSPPSETHHTIDCSAITVPGGRTLTIRIHAWGASGSGGTFRIGCGDPMTLTGTAIGTKLPPTIIFPTAAESVAVSNELSVAIGVQPAGSGIKSWSFAPSPTGAYSLSGTTFAFTPAAADEGSTFALTVIATNSYGGATNILPVTVTEYVPAGAWMTGFENEKDPDNPKSPVDWDIGGRTWSIQQLAFSGQTAQGAELPKVGARACVFGSYNPAFMVSADKMLDANHGCGSVSFLYAEYPGESEPCQPIVVEVATDLASGDWMEIGRVNPSGVTTPEKATFDILSSDPVYLRIRTEYVNKSGRVCIDQLTVLPYSRPQWTDFEQYLLRYNVTPGDPGCASENVWAEGETATSYKTDDFDEDGYSNWAEFNANPQTNPYDKTSHP